MFCGPETVDVSRGEAEGNIDSRGSTKHTAFPRSQSISILLYTEWICYLPVNKSNVHRLATLPGRQYNFSTIT